MGGGMNMDKKTQRQAEQRLILRLARSMMKKSNDAVKLAYLEGDNLTEQIDGLDLSLLSELKRNANGTVEIKLVDRVKALTELTALLREAQGCEPATRQAESFYRALETRAGEETVD